MATFNDFTVAAPRPLPVILLADVSGSMYDEGKINALNTAVADMISTFASEEAGRAEIYVAVITFGNDARLHTPLQTAAAVNWTPAAAYGGTPMGGAFELAAQLLADQEQIPARAYRPTLVLLTDGMPTDDWETGLAALSSGRAAKVERFALAIGGDADEAMLQTFLAHPERRVFHAEDARRIKDFFRFVTRSVTTRSSSADPNVIPPVSDPFADDDY